MSLTAFPNGLSSFGVPVLGGMFPFTGKYIFVKPSSGLDGNDGLSPNSPVKTLTKALALATANANDVVFLIQESNTGANTTDYQSSTLDWNKDGVHLIGINPNPIIGQRSRVALISTYVTASNLITWSANNCMVSGIEFYAGVASANPTGCMKITGDRNRFVNCQISGIGDNLMDTAGAYSLWMYGAHENLFESCYIGLDTITRGSAANAEILLTAPDNSGNMRNVFRKCIISGLCESAGNYLFLSANAAGSLGRFLLFDDCVFHNAGAASAGVAMTQAMQIHAAAGGNVILHNTTIVGAANVNASDVGLVLVGAGGIPNNATKTDLGLALVTTNA